ncbi:cation transporting ATPase C-terminal domain-containing protein [Methylocucumis oryzae]|uniref:cation transporting ATPase C-terminal domain-containing protein n=1 Tax=Methylocucumis oryzae TaxID=1632867 RepID=UPI00103E3265|nr:cation-translocating P-type ATPase C-terminal domain-containing protein [Methylocucumis oryzae]
MPVQSVTRRFNRYFFRNKTLWCALLGVVLMQITVVYWPEAQALFHTQRLTLQDWCLASAVASSILVIEELRKQVARRLRSHLRL